MRKINYYVHYQREALTEKDLNFPLSFVIMYEDKTGERLYLELDYSELAEAYSLVQDYDELARLIDDLKKEIFLNGYEKGVLTIIDTRVDKEGDAVNE